jgi:uncharacterized protein (TIGR03083 family)
MTAAAAGSTARWMATGTRLFVDSATAVGERLDETSLLPGWDRRTVVAHLVGNARALTNLVTWARTGEPTPMYASPDQRAAEIRELARLDGERLLTELVGTARRLDEDFADLPPDARDHPVVTATGRTVAAHEVLWMRAREVNVHAVDLRAGVAFADLPRDFLRALCDDAAAARRESAGLPVRLVTPEGDTWDVAGHGDPVTVRGSLADVAAYLTGRPHGLTTATGREVPGLPRWL